MWELIQRPQTKEPLCQVWCYTLSDDMRYALNNKWAPRAGAGSSQCPVLLTTTCCHTLTDHAPAAVWSSRITPHHITPHHHTTSHHITPRQVMLRVSDLDRSIEYYTKVSNTVSAVVSNSVSAVVDNTVSAVVNNTVGAADGQGRGVEGALRDVAARCHHTACQHRCWA
jgi:hypothetical protein